MVGDLFHYCHFLQNNQPRHSKLSRRVCLRYSKTAFTPRKFKFSIASIDLEAFDNSKCWIFSTGRFDWRTIFLPKFSRASLIVKYNDWVHIPPLNWVLHVSYNVRNKPWPTESNVRAIKKAQICSFFVLIRII